MSNQSRTVGRPEAPPTLAVTNGVVLLMQDSRLSTWQVVCSQILGHQLHVWSAFASSVFVRRVEVTSTQSATTV